MFRINLNNRGETEMDVESRPEILRGGDVVQSY
jgi:hypothetical protein